MGLLSHSSLKRSSTTLSLMTLGCDDEDESLSIRFEKCSSMKSFGWDHYGSFFDSNIKNVEQEHHAWRDRKRSRRHEAEKQTNVRDSFKQNGFDSPEWSKTDLPSKSTDYNNVNKKQTINGTHHNPNLSIVDEMTDWLAVTVL